MGQVQRKILKRKSLPRIWRSCPGSSTAKTISNHLLLSNRNKRIQRQFLRESYTLFSSGISIQCLLSSTTTILACEELTEPLRLLVELFCASRFALFLWTKSISSKLRKELFWSLSSLLCAHSYCSHCRHGCLKFVDQSIISRVMWSANNSTKILKIKSNKMAQLEKRVFCKRLRFISIHFGQLESSWTSTMFL